MGFTAGQRLLAASLNLLGSYLIQEQTLGAPAATVTFAGIPQTYASLRLKMVGRTSTGSGADYEDVRMQYNGIASATYSELFLYTIANTTATSALNSGQTSAIAGHMWTSVVATAGAGRCTVEIPSYATTNWFKGHTYLAHASDGGAALQSGAGGGSCQTTSAVTSLTLFPKSGNNFLAGSYFALYGES